VRSAAARRRLAERVVGDGTSNRLAACRSMTARDRVSGCLPMKNTTDLFTETVSPIAGIRTGIGGWVYPAWRRNFYPDGLVQKQELRYASRQLTAIEINGTFYRAPAPATYAKWREDTPDGFVFSVKAPRYIVESKELAATKRGIDGFVHGGLGELGDRLGPVVWQFAPWRTFDRDDVATFMDLLPRELDGRPLRHVLEPRHDSFLCKEYVALARGNGLPSVFTDSAEHPSFADITGDFIYARLMRSRSDIATGYDVNELDAWARRALSWASGGQPDDLPYVEAQARVEKTSRDVFVFFISAAKERNPAAARALHAKLAS
jgi:uncharacterized protein YecE (DUF72 family)